jgi:hypothetical protein
VIIDEVRPYVQAAVTWLEKKDWVNAERALNHVNHLLDEQEADYEPTLSSRAT